MTGKIAPAELVKSRGGRYASALGIDLAAIEGLALLVVADNLIGGIQLGEARGRLRIVLVGIGVQLLGELAVGALQFLLRGGAGDAEDLVIVALRHGQLLTATRTIDSRRSRPL